MNEEELPLIPNAFRPALRLATTLMLDDILHCLVEGSEVFGMALAALPPNYIPRIEQDLFRWSVAFTVAGQKLAERDPLPPACVAENIAMFVILDFAAGILQEGPEFGFQLRVPTDRAEYWRDEVLEELHGDMDFLFLYDAMLDGIGADPDEPLGAMLRTVNLAYADWFRAFEGRVAHPYYGDDPED
jgi:hypothetical protein